MKNLLIIISAIVVASCAEPLARKPVSQSSGSYINESVARNKEMIAAQEKFIQNMIAADSLNSYEASANGFWYTYVVKDTLNAQNPVVGDLVLFSHNLETLDGRIIKSKEEIGNQVTQIDQSNQDLISGIREGLKIMKEGETMTFLLPSHKAFGYYGLENSIGSNIPIKTTVTLLEIKDQPKY